MKGAGGEDGWHAREVCHLPLGAFQLFWCLLDMFSRTSSLPREFSQSCMVCLPKPGKVVAGKVRVQDTRPITIQSVWWRLLLTSVYRTSEFKGWLRTLSLRMWRPLLAKTFTRRSTLFFRSTLPGVASLYSGRHQGVRLSGRRGQPGGSPAAQMAGHPPSPATAGLGPSRTFRAMGSPHARSTKKPSRGFWVFPFMILGVLVLFWSVPYADGFQLEMVGALSASLDHHCPSGFLCRASFHGLAQPWLGNASAETDGDESSSGYLFSSDCEDFAPFDAEGFTSVDRELFVGLPTSSQLYSYPGRCWFTRTTQDGARCSPRPIWPGAFPFLHLGA